MSKVLFILFFLIFSLGIAQQREIKGDTLNWYQQHNMMVNSLGLTNFKRTTDEFAFRFSNYGQVVEITKKRDTITGSITNYIFWQRPHKNTYTDTLFNKVNIPPDKALATYNLVQNSGVLELDTDENIEGWMQGSDGITYTIEYIKGSIYNCNSYWSPHSQHDLPEAKLVASFVHKLSDTLMFEKVYQEFKETLPQRGCYTRGGMVASCYSSSNYIGYAGTNRLPFGIIVSTFFPQIGSWKSNMRIYGTYMFDKENNSDLLVGLMKGYIFSRKKSGWGDALSYNFRNRKMDFITPDFLFTNHKAEYLIWYEDYSIFLGTDFLSSDLNKEVGVIVAPSVYINTLKVRATMEASLFNSHTDYKASLSKTIHVNFLFIDWLFLELSNERFMNYNSAGLLVEFNVF